jgi:hypothetical protein
LGARALARAVEGEPAWLQKEALHVGPSVVFVSACGAVGIFFFFLYFLIFFFKSVVLVTACGAVGTLKPDNAVGIEP